VDRFQHFIAELTRRHVLRALAVWAIASFAVLQVIEPVLHAYHLPEWMLTAAVTVLGAGFPATALLAWVFDLTATGIIRTGTTDGDTWRGSSLSSPRLAALLLAIGLLAAAPGVIYFFVWPGTGRRAEAASRAGPDVPSIAVLPFVNLSSDKGQEYFADGVAEEILNALSRVGGLRVMGRTSSFYFKGKDARLSEIGRELNVKAILEGSVRQDGSHVRVTARVSEVASGTQLWSQSYDRELTDIFTVQDEIAGAVVAALRIRVLPGQEPSTRPYRTPNPEVYNQYLLGHRFFARESKDGMRRAVEAFEKAVDLEPGYAPALAGLGLALTLQELFSWNAAGWGSQGQRALEAAEKAVAIAPDLAEARATRGKTRSWIAWDWAGALPDLELAVRLNPGDALVQQQYSALLASLGRRLEAILAGRRATELDPLRGNSWQLLSYWYAIDGQFGQARTALDRAGELNPDSEVVWLRRFQLSLWEGKPERALAELGAAHRNCQVCLAMAQHSLGHALESQRALDTLLASSSAAAPYQIAAAYAWRGEVDSAFAWLDRAVAMRHPDLVFVKVDPALKALHGDRRFQALLRRMNLPVD
jgi:serine/threonine-protein kinase